MSTTDDRSIDIVTKALAEVISTLDAICAEMGYGASRACPAQAEPKGPQNAA